MKASIHLADAAQAVDGKIYALGLGFNIFNGSPTPPHAIAIILDVDWNETNQPITVVAELLDGDGQQVLMPSNFGAQPVRVEIQMEVGRPPGMPHGTPVRVPFAGGIGPLPLSTNARYEWRVTVNGQHEENWSDFFTVLPAPQQ